MNENIIELNQKIQDLKSENDYLLGLKEQILDLSEQKKMQVQKYEQQKQIYEDRLFSQKEEKDQEIQKMKAHLNELQ